MAKSNLVHDLGSVPYQCNGSLDEILNKNPNKLILVKKGDIKNVDFDSKGNDIWDNVYPLSDNINSEIKEIKAVIIGSCNIFIDECHKNLVDIHHMLKFITGEPPLFLSQGQEIIFYSNKSFVRILILRVRDKKLYINFDSGLSRVIRRLKVIE
jgi:hypothetical protein